MTDEDEGWGWDAQYDAVHRYQPDKTGRCTGGWYNAKGTWVECHSTQRSSTLHDDPDSDFRQQHDHGGGDCMCFENEEGPSYYEAMEQHRKEWLRGSADTTIVVLRITTFEAKPVETWDWNELLDLGPYEKVEVIGTARDER